MRLPSTACESQHYGVASQVSGLACVVTHLFRRSSTNKLQRG